MMFLLFMQLDACSSILVVLARPNKSSWLDYAEQRSHWWKKGKVLELVEDP